MSSFFSPGRGCVYSTGGGGSGWYKLDGLGGGNVLILGAQLMDADLIYPVNALGDIQIMYVFGRRFGDVQVLGSVLCGPADSNGGSFGKVLSFFEGKRVSSSKGTTNLSVPGGKNYKVFIHGLGLSQPDANLHIQPFVIYGKIASASNGQ